MKTVTLYSQNRDGLFGDLPEVHQSYLKKALQSVSGPAELLAPTTKVFAFERYLDIHYVDRGQDLSTVQPISLKEYYIEYTQKVMQPLLDALAVGDFEMAEALTPEKLRLIGYTEMKETTIIRQEGVGWAGQYSVTEVPPGIYPIFTDKFHYHERDQHYTNEVETCHVYQWFAGTETASSSIYFTAPEPNVVFEKPYAFSLAADVLAGKGNAHLIYPFRPLEYAFDDHGDIYKTHKIVDGSVMYQAEGNPIKLRGRCVPPGPDKVSLYEKLRQADAKRSEKKLLSPENASRANLAGYGR